MIDFIMPESKRDEGENPIVDSLAVSSKWTIVAKCALHGLIYVWDLRATIDEIKKTEAAESKEKAKKDGKKGSKGDEEDDEEDTEITEQDVKMLARLKWSDTDNFYMNLGCHKGTSTFRFQMIKKK